MSLDVRRVFIIRFRLKNLPSTNDNDDVLEVANGVRTSVAQM